jgi:hypothetical protein
MFGSIGIGFSLRKLCALCVSAVNPGRKTLTAETQRAQRTRREGTKFFSERLCSGWPSEGFGQMLNLFSFGSVAWAHSNHRFVATR